MPCRSYYDIETFRDGDPAEGKAELIIAKHRNGSLADVRLRFQGSMARFSDLENVDAGPMILESKINSDSYLGGAPGGGGSEFNTGNENDDFPF